MAFTRDIETNNEENTIIDDSRTDQINIAQFLAHYPPFDALTPEQLHNLAECSQVLSFDNGTIIHDGHNSARDFMWVVHSGQVGLWNVSDEEPSGHDFAQSPTEIVHRGGIFSYTVVLQASVTGPRSAALTDVVVIRIPGSQARPVFASLAGTAFLAREVTVNSHVSGVSSRDSTLIPASAVAMVRRKPLVCRAGTLIQEAARLMTDNKTGHILVIDGDEIGLLTDKIIRTRLVAQGLSLETPVERIALFPAPAIPSSCSGADAMVKMLEEQLRYLVVQSSSGEALGVIHADDFLTAPSKSGFMLRRRIQLAGIDELIELGPRINEVAGNMFTQGVKALQISSVISVLLEALVRRAINLTLMNSDVGDEDFVWYVLGSVARHEATMASDIDSATLIHTPRSSTVSRDKLRRLVIDFSKQIHTILQKAGINTDTNGATAANPLFTRYSTEWKQDATKWVGDPLSNNAMMMASLTLDSRALWGIAQSQPVRSVYRNLHRHPRAYKLFLQETLATKATTRNIKVLLRPINFKNSDFDIKGHGIVPIVNIARWLGIQSNNDEVSTLGRLQAAKGGTLLPDEHIEALTEAFEQLVTIRMRHQFNQISDGKTPDNIITLRKLSAIDRSVTIQAVHQVAVVQKRLANAAAYTDILDS